MVMLDRSDYVDLLYASHSVQSAQDWGYKIGLEYWARFGEDPIGVTTEGNFITAWGWTSAGAPPYVAPSGANFADPAVKGTTGGVHLDTAEDTVISPAIFGSYTHMKQVAELINARDLPTKLICDMWARFSATNNEPGTGIGFVEDGGSPAVANDHMACFAAVTGGFVLRSGAATSAILQASDNGPHHFRVVVDRLTGLCHAFIDEMHTPKGTIAIQAAEWPARWGGGVVAAGANDPVIDTVRIRYSFGGWH